MREDCALADEELEDEELEDEELEDEELEESCTSGPIRRFLADGSFTTEIHDDSSGQH